VFEFGCLRIRVSSGVWVCDDGTNVFEYVVELTYLEGLLFVYYTQSHETGIPVTLNY